MVKVHSFFAAYNQALLSKHRIFTAAYSSINYDLVKYLYTSGYILGYHIANSRISVYPNYASCTLTRIKVISAPSYPVYYTASKLVKELKAGKNYIVYAQSIFFDSKFSAMNNAGGLVVALLI
jgi:ribosomal protein S8